MNKPVSIPQWFDSNQMLTVVTECTQELVSIPQWFDSNTITKETNEIKIIVSIPQWFDSNQRGLDMPLWRV